MKRTLVLLASWWLTPACGDDGGSDWPDRLYLALIGSETMVQLAEQEPEPF